MGGGKIDVAADLRDLLRAFADHDVCFLIVGTDVLAALLTEPRRFAILATTG